VIAVKHRLIEFDKIAICPRLATGSKSEIQNPAVNATWSRIVWKVQQSHIATKSGPARTGLQIVTAVGWKLSIRGF